MKRTRVKLAVYVDLDPLPGGFHTAESAQHNIRALLDHQILHYKPTVSIESYDTRKGSEIEMRFGQANNNWTSKFEHNIAFIRSIQSYYNNYLSARGFVLLNDLYDSLGFARTAQGCTEGWVAADDGHNLSTIQLTTITSEDEEDAGVITITTHTQGDIRERAFG